MRIVPLSRGHGERGGRCLWSKDTSPLHPLQAGHLPPGHPRPVPLGRGETRGDSEFQHRRGIAIPGPFGAANRAASSKQARFIRHWRRFACFPHTPLKRPDQGACGPLFWTTPPEGERKEKQFHSLTTPKARRQFGMRRRAISVSPAWGAPGTGLQVCTAPATTTKNFAQKGAIGAGFARKRLSFPPLRRRLFFGRNPKKSGGRIPVRRSRAHSPRRPGRGAVLPPNPLYNSYPIW